MRRARLLLLCGILFTFAATPFYALLPARAAPQAHSQGAPRLPPEIDRTPQAFETVDTSFDIDSIAPAAGPSKTERYSPASNDPPAETKDNLEENGNQTAYLEESCPQKFIKIPQEIDTRGDGIAILAYYLILASSVLIMFSSFRRKTKKIIGDIIDISYPVLLPALRLISYPNLLIVAGCFAAYASYSSPGFLNQAVGKGLSAIALLGGGIGLKAVKVWRDRRAQP